jgi:prolyl-tRNA synthetase
VRVKADLRDESPGWKFNEWEMRGIPLRLELGPRDVENNQCVLARRDTGEKVTVNLDEAVSQVSQLLEQIQANMFAKASAFRSEHSHLQVETLEGLKAHLAEMEAAGKPSGWVLAGWCGDAACEVKVKEETKFTSRNIPFNPPQTKSTCITCGREAQHTLWFARAY